MNLAINKRGEATEQIVQYLKKFYTFKTTRSDDASEIWIYEKGIYKPEGKTYIQETCRTMLELTYTTHLAKNSYQQNRSRHIHRPRRFLRATKQTPIHYTSKKWFIKPKNKKIKSFQQKYCFLQQTKHEL